MEGTCAGRHILIIGGGFAGVWTAASAAKLRHQQHVSEQALRITLMSSGDDLVIRPRLYQDSPQRHRVALDDILGPVALNRMAAVATRIDTAAQRVHVVLRSGMASSVEHDRFVLAAGSQLVRPKLAGAEHLFDVDTLAGAAALGAPVILR